MNFTITIDSREINVKLINKKNVRHCYLRILENNLLQITANRYFTKNDALELIENKKNWLKKHLSKASKNLKTGEYLYLGEVYKSKFMSQEDILEFYKEKAPEVITPLVEKHSKRMNLFPSSLKYRNNKSRWGSCSYKNAVNLNINLLKFPLEVIEYVIIHELSHIEHKNHSKKFWNLVEFYCPDYKNHELTLKSF